MKLVEYDYKAAMTPYETSNGTPKYVTLRFKNTSNFVPVKFYTETVTSSKNAIWCNYKNTTDEFDKLFVYFE